MRAPAKKESLLALLPWEPSDESLQRIRDAYPGIAVAAHRVDWGSREVPDQITAEQLADVTILLTGPVVPDKEAVPKMKLVQLASAGANHVLERPLFKDTDVKFCTANGVHG